MASVSPYPHVEIGVRDESIYVPIVEENLPLHKPLYFMRTVKGPVNVPVWCPTYTYATQIFGDDTFNPRSKYFSEQAYFLLQTFPSNGAFIMRVAGAEARNADIVIECGVSKNAVDVPQWERDANGAFVLELNGSKVPINSNGEVCKELTAAEAVAVYARAMESLALEGRQYFSRNSNFDYMAVEPLSRAVKGVTYYKGVGLPTFSAVDTTAGVDASAMYFVVSTETVEGDEVTKLTPAFGLSEFAAGTTYAKLTGFASGYRAATITYNPVTGEYDPETSEVPQIAIGQTVGDRFVGPTAISTSGIVVEQTGTGAEATYTAVAEGATKTFSTFVFTRALNEANPYTYTQQVIPAGTYIQGLGLWYYVGQSEEGELEPQGVITGRAIAWRARVVPKDSEGNRSRAVGAATSNDSDNFTWYPMLDVVANNPGAWGGNFAVKFYYDKNINTISLTNSYGATMFTLAPVELKEGDTLPTEIYDQTGGTNVAGVAKPSTYDPESDVDLTLKNRIPNVYAGNNKLPVTITPVAENFNVVGKILMETEIAARASILSLYENWRTITDSEGSLVAETFVDALMGKAVVAGDIADEVGYKTNPLSLLDAEEIPYFATYLVDAEDPLIKTDTKIDLNSQMVYQPGPTVPVYLGGGEDGPIADADIESYIRATITVAKAHNHEYLNDYPRCPFNSIIDTGVSLKTKKAYLDIMSFRDNVVVNLATQTTWKTAAGTNPSVAGYFPNLKSDDESIGSSLRAYAWLMREDINNGTEACRAKIFLHAGYRADHEGPIASTLWIAMKNAQYLNLDHLEKEAKGLPNAAVECWTDISWRASSEDTKSRCWNAGLNYVQNYGMNNIMHYASVRSVYRYETSVLVDAGVVDALTFTKDIIRRSWAKFAGMTLPAAELNSLIQDDLTKRLTYMINGKYEIAVNVYQTDEDVKLGFCRHVDVILTSPGTNRVWLATVIVRREGYTAE